MVSPKFLRVASVVLSATQWLLVVTLAVVGWHVATDDTPSPNPESALTETTASPESQTIEAEEFAPLADYAVIWQRDLRQPPIPPPVKPEDPPRPLPPPPTLLGTFFEGEKGWAHLAAENGKTRVLTTGGVINEYTIVAIEPGRVQVRNGQHEEWIQAVKPKPVIVRRR